MHEQQTGDTFYRPRGIARQTTPELASRRFRKFRHFITAKSELTESSTDEAVSWLTEDG